MQFDLAIINGTIIDGTGQPRFKADLGIREGRIAAVARGQSLTGQRTIDAAGLIVSPGFVDVHSHSDWVLPQPDHDQVLAPYALQGITTLATGNCGTTPAPITDESLPFVDDRSATTRDGTFPYRWRSFGEFLDRIEEDGLFLNAAFLVGHGTLRYGVMGERASAPSAEELAALLSLLRQSIREGAFGLSVGLAYVPGIFADNDELLALLRIVVQEDGVYTVHGRSYQYVSPFYQSTDIPHNVLSNREQLDLARQSGVKIQLSHLIFNGRRAWTTYGTVLQDIEHAAEEGVDVAFDAFPYVVGNTTIKVLFPAWFLDGFTQNIDNQAALSRLGEEVPTRLKAAGRGFGDIILLWTHIPELSEFEGLNFSTIAERLNMPDFAAYTHIARLSEGKARILHGPFSGDWDYEEPLRAVLAHPLCAFETDTTLTRRGKQNPASFGTYPRLLGRYCRDLGLFSLEEAVRRSTSFPAQRIGLKDVGRIAEGLWADLVLFDPATVSDNTTHDRFDVPPSGIRAVAVSGYILVEDGKIVSRERPGRVLRR